MKSSDSRAGTFYQEYDDILLKEYSPNLNHTQDTVCVGDSHLVGFRQAISTRFWNNKSLHFFPKDWCKYSWMDFDSNKNLTHIEIKDEYEHLVDSTSIKNMDILIMVGMGLAGAHIILGEGKLRKEFSPKFNASDETLVNFYKRDMQLKLSPVRQLDETTPYKKVFWVVNPDMCITAARFRIGDEFVDSGLYLIHKQAYLEAFHECTLDFKKIRFIFHNDNLSDSITGFTLNKYQASNYPQDIHCNGEYYTGAVNKINHLLTADNMKLPD